MEFSFFTTNNKSGYKTRENWLFKNHPDLYEKIINYSQQVNLELSFKEKIWFYYNQLTERPKCITCSKDLKFRERFDTPYGEFCSLSCINTNKDEMLNRQKTTFNKKYGIDFYPQHQDFIKKQQNTKLKKYGNKNYNNVEKAKNTKLKKHGNSNYNNMDLHKKKCLAQYGVDNYSKSKEFILFNKNRFEQIYSDFIIKEYNKDSIIIFCEKCNNYSKLLKHQFFGRVKYNNIVCTNCNKLGQSFISSKELEINDFINSLGFNTIQTYKTDKEKMEIDILIPEKNIGIELNGLYWHSELFKDEKFHLRKTEISNSNNIELIHIFEDEWNRKKDIVKSILKNRLGISQNKVYARNCTIKLVNSKECYDFLEKNHIQGRANSSIKIGLYHNEELISLMTFSKGRIIMGGKESEWELVRFANKINTNVIGSASKLLNFFINNYKPKKIVSYSDIRLFNGGLYEKLGFTKISKSKPNYWYVINGVRHHRFNFRKSILVKQGFDKNKTEQEIMLERKIHRIYDCGAIRWELTID